MTVWSTARREGAAGPAGLGASDLLRQRSAVLPLHGSPFAAAFLRVRCLLPSTLPLHCLSSNVHGHPRCFALPSKHHHHTTTPRVYNELKLLHVVRVAFFESELHRYRWILPRNPLSHVCQFHVESELCTFGSGRCAELVWTCFMNGAPHHGLGRPMKAVRHPELNVSAPAHTKPPGLYLEFEFRVDAGQRGDHGLARGAWSGTPIRDTSCCCHPLAGLPYLRFGPRRPSRRGSHATTRRRRRVLPTAGTTFCRTTFCSQPSPVGVCNRNAERSMAASFALMAFYSCKAFVEYGRATLQQLVCIS